MTSECMCKEIYCIDNNLNPDRVFVCEDDITLDLYLISDNRQRIYNFCKCNDKEFKVRVEQLKKKELTTSIRAGKNFKILKAICDKIGLDIEELLE